MTTRERTKVLDMSVLPDRRRDRATRVLRVTREVLFGTYGLMMGYAVFVVFAWAICLAGGNVYEDSGDALKTMARMPEISWSILAGFVILIPLISFWLNSPKWADFGMFLVGMFLWALAGSIAAQSWALPGVWTYGALGILCVVPLWRRTLY